MSTSDNLVQVNGFWVDLTTVQSTLIVALSSYSLLSVKLVSSSTNSRLALFFTALSDVDELVFLKAAREALLSCPSFPEPLASTISFSKQLRQMPLDQNGDIDVSALRFIAEERWEAKRASRRSRLVLNTPNFGPVSNGLLSPQSARQPGAARIAPMTPMAASAFRSPAFPPIPEVPEVAIYSPDSTRVPFPESFSPQFSTAPTNPPPTRPSSIPEISLTSRIALEISSHITTLLSLPASSAVPTYLPLKLAGLNSVATAQLYFWLQERYEYEEDITHLFGDNVNAEVIAAHITGDSTARGRSPSASAATAGSVSSSYSGSAFQPAHKGFDDIDLETGLTMKLGKDQDRPQVYTIDPNPISYVFVSWITSLVWKGSKKPIAKDDLFDLNPKDSSTYIDGWISQFWAEYDSFGKQQRKELPRLWGSMMSYARGFFIVSALLWFLSILMGLFGPILIQQLIIAASAPERPKTSEGANMFDDAIKEITGGVPLFTPTLWVLALSLFGTKVFQTISGRTSENMIKNTALNVKTALIGAVYKKSLRLGPRGIGRFEKGYILNLVNVDAEAVSKAIELGNLTWSIPIQLGVTVYLLYRVLGVSVWAGVGVLFGALLVLILVVPIFFRTSAPMFAHFGDRRMKLIKEIMEGMTLIKVRGWEGIFLQRLEAIRQTQLKYLRTFNSGVTVFVIVGQLANTLVPIAALSLFGENKGTITAARIFPALSFFAMLVEPLIALPQLLSACAIAASSWGRIYTFLMASEAAPVSFDLYPDNTDPIRISSGSFEWVKKQDALVPAADENAEKPKAFIHNINMSIKKGSLTAIVGPVGCGKSSLFAAILGEMQCVSGEVVANGSIAYCPQQPWIQSTTIQENITFGKPTDTQRLKRAIGAASFAADLERLPNGIASEVAERGANLSGGQKARLSLARAIYVDADLYLLDDPLAALDPRVGHTVFQECILEVLHGKTRLLVTQALNFLPKVDHVIVLNNGTIAEQGSYAELYRQNGLLRKMVDAVEKRAEKVDKRSGKQQETTESKKVTKAGDVPSGGIVSEEDVITGAISGSTWWAYIKAAGGWKTVATLLLSVLSQQAGAVMMNQWLTWWTTNQFHQKIEFWFGIYDGIGVATAFLMVIVNTFIFFGVLAASRTFHNRAFSGVIGASMGWFHANPAGRVINRFSKDMESIDQRVMPQIFQVIAGFGSMITAVAILGRSSPVILGVLAPLFLINWFLLRFYRATIRELKRLESRMRSPLQSKVNETLDGIPTIAAFKRENDFASSATRLIDDSNKPVYLRNAAEIWLTIRMELLSALVVLTIAMLGKTSKVMNTSQFGSALAYATALTYIMNLLVKAAATIESEMSSVERLQEYSEKLPQDSPPHLPDDPVEGSWPSHGEIVFTGVEAAYPSRPEKPVLKDVNIRIRPGATVFIVGRTGSGKSTLLLVLLRLLELGKGRILVDGVNISELGVHALRRGMELIPQDPFIFSGTIRTALDFEGRYDDTSLWHALELVGLKDFVSNQENQLDTVVSDNGSNYSVGQRQLLCLAGAILRNPKILLLDEATASVDAGSDAFLQKTMRVNCPGATILSVMHRLSDQVLKECDYVLVMDEGTPAEFDSPRALMANPDSLFSLIMEATKQA